MAFIEIHPKAKPAELLLLNVSDIEYAYQDHEDNGSVIRLHGDGRTTMEISETYEQLKTLIAKAANS